MFRIQGTKSSKLGAAPVSMCDVCVCVCVCARARACVIECKHTHTYMYCVCVGKRVCVSIHTPMYTCIV
jgi:hypothetical protein